MLAINGFKIDSRGDYDDPDFGRLSMSHIVRGKAFVGEDVEMLVLRAGKEVALKGKLVRASNRRAAWSCPTSSIAGQTILWPAAWFSRS